MASGGDFGLLSGQAPVDSEISAIAAEISDLVDRMELDVRASGRVSADDAERLRELRLRLEQIVVRRGG